MNKLYSLRLKGDNVSTLIELSRSALAILQNGGFVLGRRHNTKTGEVTDFGFNSDQVASLAETKVENVELEGENTEEKIDQIAF